MDGGYMSDQQVSEMGRVLRHIKGDQNIGEGPIEVKTRINDFNIVSVNGPQGETAIPANTLISFNAQTWREIDGADVWEFRVMSGEGAPVPGRVMNMYVAGRDLLTVRLQSKVL
jgi:hypothetical protein